MSAVVKFYENVEDQLLKFAVIIAKTDGKSVFAPDITEYHCEQIGRILGKIHAANITIDIMERQAAGKEYYQWKHLLEQVEEKIRSAMDFYRNIGLYNLTILCYQILTGTEGRTYDRDVFAG